MSASKVFSLPNANAAAPDILESWALQAIAMRERGGHSPDIAVRLRAIEDQAITVSRLLGTHDGDAP